MTRTEKKLVDLPLLIERAKLTILSPKECWQKISNENTSPKELVRSVVAPLLVLGVVLSVIGLQVFGIYMGPLGTWRPPFFPHLFSQIGFAIISVVMLYVSAFIVQKLAGLFHGTATPERAFSLVTHAVLPMMVGNHPMMVGNHPMMVGDHLPFYPILGILGTVFTVISVMALYHGIPAMTTVAPNKTLGFIAAYICIMILAWLVINAAYICIMILASLVIDGLAAFVVPLPQPPLMS